MAQGARLTGGEVGKNLGGLWVPPKLGELGEGHAVGLVALEVFAGSFEGLFQGCGGAGMVRAEDNLESTYARLALRRFFAALYTGAIKACSLTRFQEMTGLDLLDSDGMLGPKPNQAVEGVQQIGFPVVVLRRRR